MQKDDGWEVVAQSIIQMHDLKTRRVFENSTAVAAASSATASGGSTTSITKSNVPHSLLSITMMEYTEFMHTILQRALSAATTNSMRAAITIAEKIGDSVTLNETRRKVKIQKFRQFVIKDKWMIAAQVEPSLSSSLRFLFFIYVSYSYVRIDV